MEEADTLTYFKMIKQIWCAETRFFEFHVTTKYFPEPTVQLNSQNAVGKKEGLPLQSVQPKMYQNVVQNGLVTSNLCPQNTEM